MAGNLIYITDAGRAALVAPGNTGTTAHQVTQIGLATAAFAFKPDMTALPSELKRITTFGGDTVAQDTIHIVIQDDSADQYKLYGFGLYLDNGVLFSVYVQDDPILEKAPASMLLLAADTVFASIDVTKLVFGPTSFLNPPATTERKGVVELATQAEVDDGADDTRAVTPKTAAKRYAPLVRAQLIGPVSVTSTSTDQDAQLAVAATSGALNRGAKIRFHGTFAAGTADTNARLIASIRAGYDGGTWGREYLDFWINRAPNDSNSDTNQVRAMRITYGGRLVVGNRNDNGNDALQVAGNGAFSGSVGSSGLDTGGANFRLLNSRDVLLRNDGSNFYVLLSDTSGADAKWNNFRPLTVNVVTGALMLDDTGVGTFVGGPLSVKGLLNIGTASGEGRAVIGPNGGYFFGNASEAGFYLPANGAMFALNFTRKNLHVNGKDVWHAGNLPNPAQTTGFTMSGQILAAEGSVSAPGISFVGDGAPDTGFFHVADGVFAVANNAKETMRFVAGATNRVLIGGTPDDFYSALQVGGAASFTGAAPGNGLAAMGSGVLLGNNGGGTIIFKSATAAADMKVWDFKAGDGVFQGRAVTDGWTSGVPWINVARQSNNNAIQSIALAPNSGRVLIGATADDGANAAQVSGSVRAANYFINGQGVGDSGLIGISKGANGPNIGFYGSATTGAGAVTFSTGGTERARISAIGNLLIGTAADDGANKLQIAGAAKLSGALYSAAAIIDSGAGWSTIYLKNGGKNRWTIGKSDTDDFAVSAFDDDGVTQRRVLDIPRASQVVSFVKRPTWAGATPWDSANLTPLDRNIGGQVNGNVTLYGAGDYGSQLVFNSNGYAPRIQVQASTSTWMVTNSANTAANLMVNEGGTVIARGELQTAGGATRVALDGNLYGSVWGGWLSNFLSNNYVNRSGTTMWGRLMLARDGWDADFGLRAADGAQTFLRARRGGGIELINSAYNAVTWQLDDSGTMFMRGQQILNTDGNLFCAYRGAWMNAILDDLYNRDNGKANAGARVQWDSGVNNFGTIDRLNGALPAPWVVCGLSGPGNGTANAIVVYGVVLRNQ
ncbi:phage tail protein [Burkholderia sp. Bp9142]|uniref:phage tail protein n=1 Tax=Burkholderia sp. Bp9142 TaxID=2184573 RepID=UPI000F5B5883|nr:phage tail protein [Burkholderia sp. Bp9142]